MQATARRYETPLPGPRPTLSDEEAMRRDRTLVDVPVPNASPKPRTGPPPIPLRKAPVDWAKTIEEFREEARKRNRLLESTITDHRATKRLLSDVAARTHNLDTRLGELADILNNHDDWRAYHDGRFDGHDRQIQYLGVTMEQVVALLDKLGIEINTGMVTDQEFNDRLAHLEAVVSALQHTQPQPIIRQACATSVTAETTPFPWFKVLATASVLGAIGSIFAIHFF